MEVHTFVLLYFGATAALVFVMLFGPAPAFQRTPVAWAYWLLTQGCVDSLEWAVEKALGARGVQLLEDAATCCCERSNPILQFVYLSAFAGSYFLYSQYVFSLMPSDLAPIHHIFTGTGCACLAIGSFLVACGSDPGRITPDNAAAYLAAYPPDGVIYEARPCATCGFARPARSKHCNACGRCVARVDHHCGWTNNCVGLRNTRHFLAFLAANLILCVYACALCFRAIWGDLARRGVLDMYVYDAAAGRPVPVAQKPARILEYMVVYYGVASAIGMFAAVCALLLAGFLGHQCWVIGSGTSTYEAAKLRELRARQGAAARRRGGESGSSSEGEGSEAPGGAASARRLGAFHRGSVWANFSEVLFPDRFMRAQLAEREREAEARRQRRGCALLPPPEPLKRRAKSKR